MKICNAMNNSPIQLLLARWQECIDGTERTIANPDARQRAGVLEINRLRTVNAVRVELLAELKTAIAGCDGDCRRIDWLEQVLCYAMVCLPNKSAMESLAANGLGWTDGELRRAIDKHITAT